MPRVRKCIGWGFAGGMLSEEQSRRPSYVFRTVNCTLGSLFTCFTAGHIGQRRSYQICKEANGACAESEIKMLRYAPEIGFIAKQDTRMHVGGGGGIREAPKLH